MGACWEELDLERGIWTVPKEWMKAGREHRVPLCRRTKEIFSRMSQIRTGDLVFAGLKRDRPLSKLAWASGYKVGIFRTRHRGA
jgi:integrase